MRFLSPRTDYAFRKIFGSDDSRDILISFLNAVLALTEERAIVEVAILDPYQVPRIEGWKSSYVDVRARDGLGRWFIVEMQVLNHDGFEKRILYNACKAYVGQIARAEEFVDLVEVIAITITDFVMYPALEGVIHTFRLRPREKPDIAINDMSLTFIELPKFTKSEADLTGPLDRWLYFLRRAGDLTAVPAALSIEPAIDHALAIANRAGLSKEEEEDLERREQWIGMQRNMFSLAQRQGRTEGRTEGLAEGETKGRAAMLARQLRRRFGDVPAEIDRRLAGASVVQLDIWSETFVDAETLDQVFIPPPEAQG